MQYCPVCKSPLHEARHGNVAGLRCPTNACLFNFSDVKCEKCGGGPVRVERTEMGVYRVFCEEGHMTSITSTD